MSLLAVPEVVKMATSGVAKDENFVLSSNSLSSSVYQWQQKSHNAPLPYLIIHHSEQKCAHFCSEWCIVGYGTGALVDLQICFNVNFYPRPVLAFGYCHRLRLCVCPCVCVYQSLACPHDNSSAVHARITKFGRETQNTLVKMPIIFGGDRPWPSRSNLTWKLKFTSFSACPHDNFSLV